jgi:hypothetical protein
LSNSSDTPEQTQKLCRTCSQLIPSLAKKCTHCGDFQDWRSHLGMSTTVLSLLVALVSVSSQAIPVILSAIKPEASAEIRATLQGSDRFFLTILATNTGQLTGGVNRVYISAKNRSAVWFQEPNTFPVFIGSNSETAIRFIISDKVRLRNAEGCQLHVVYFDSKGRVFESIQDFECGLLSF